MSAASPEVICNLALAKLGADPIVSLSAPIKANEKLMALQYPHVRDTELRLHRWLFSLEVVRLTPTGVPINNDIDGLLYRYTWPNAALRAVRTLGCTWTVRGRELLDPSSTYIDAKFVMQKSTALFDDLFTEALVCKLAEVCCEKITQSTDKKQDMKDDHKRALDEARRTNAFELGPELVTGGDDSYSFLVARNI